MGTADRAPRRVALDRRGDRPVMFSPRRVQFPNDKPPTPSAASPAVVVSSIQSDGAATSTCPVNMTSQSGPT
ncbi:hypothetical protein [Mycobacterium intracellulare]|uniref:hypothetical protein n=1 Tax=Mycobacterium intracellulare TaxID=1767 RepID=UPI0001B45762|nr:hypothetical protein [Mycobacterium intracellulare]